MRIVLQDKVWVEHSDNIENTNDSICTTIFVCHELITPTVSQLHTAFLRLRSEIIQSFFLNIVTYVSLQFNIGHGIIFAFYTYPTQMFRTYLPTV